MNFKKLIQWNVDDVKVYFLCLIAAMMLFKVNFGNMAIIIALGYNLVYFKRNNFKKVSTFASIFPIGFFLFTIISSLISKKNIEGLLHTNLEILLLLILLIIIGYDIKKETITKVFNWFYYAAVISTSLLLTVLIVKIIEGEKLNNLIFHKFTVLYDQHPVYFAMFLSLALFFKIVVAKKPERPSLALIFNFILVLGLVFCVSKAILTINLVTYLIYYLVKINEFKKRIIYIFTILIITIAIFKIPFVKHRFADGLRFSSEITNFKPTNDFSKKKIFNYEQKTNISDLELRYILWRIGYYHLIEDDKLLIGYGQGDAQDYLDYYYFSYNLAPNWNEGRNVHNQYLHILVTYGLIVFLFFLSYLSYSFYKAIKYKNILHLFFLAIVSFVFIFEVLLVRNKGIVFFYFFNTLFLFKYINIENSNFRNPRNT